MKIAIACFNLGWLAGGPRLIFEQAIALEQLGHKVVIYAPDFDANIYPDLSKKLDIRRVAADRPLFIHEKSGSIFANVRRKIAEERAKKTLARAMVEALDSDTDVLNCHDFSYIMVPAYKNKKKEGKVVWTMHEPPFMYLPKTGFIYDILSRAFNIYRNFSTKRYFRHIDAVVVVNERNKRWAIAHGLRNVGVVRPGVQADHFYGPVKHRKAGDKKIRLLSVGAPNQYRRFEDTMLATTRLREAGYDARVTIVGKNIWHEDTYCEYLKSIARDYDFFDKAEFHFEGVSEEELLRIYHGCDVFVLPIHLPAPRNGYGWQLTGFEAMAAGLPVVISRANDSVEVLEDGKTALFVDPMRPDKIAEKVKWLVDHPDRYFEIASRAQRFVAADLTWKKYAEGILALL